MAVVDIRWQVAIISAIHQIFDRIRTLYGVEMTMVRLGEGSVTMVCNSERPFGMDA